MDPDPRDVAVYERLYPMYRELYFAMGTPDSPPLSVGHVLPAVRAIAAEVRGAMRQDEGLLRQ